MASKISVLIVSLLVLSLVMLVTSTGYSVDQYHGKCDFVGGCHTKDDCAEPCAAAGHSPAAVICVPDPTGGSNGKMCCCILE
ncbi:unnamed protein product [Musa banksii]